MHDEERRALCLYRMELAKQRLATAKRNMDEGDIKSAVNRLYYSVHSAMRAVYAIEGKDFAKHTGILSNFARDFIKTGVFPKEMSQTMYDLFSLRQDCDYDDFVVVTPEQYAQLQIAAQGFIDRIAAYLSDIE